MRGAGGSLASAMTWFGALAAHGLSHRTAVTALLLCRAMRNRGKAGAGRRDPDSERGTERAWRGEAQDMEHQE